MNYPIKISKGKDIANIIESLGKLRITIFKDYPYLYDGNMEYEKAYLKTYSSSNNSIVSYLQSNQHFIGACTAMPLNEEVEAFTLPLQKAGYDINKMFYLGEILIDPKFRNKKLGKKLIENTIVYIKTHFPQYQQVVICTIDRKDKEELKPANYQDLSFFWTKYHFQKQANLQVLFPWKDLGDQEESLKPMVYWIKELY